MDRAEKIGLGAATAGHVVLFGLLSVGFLATPNPMKMESNPVEVTFADEVALEAAAPRASQEPPATSVAPELGEPEPAPPLPAAEAQPEPSPAPPEPAPAPIPSPKPRPAKPPVRQQQPPAKAAAARPAPPTKSGTAPARPTSAARAAPKGARLGPDFLKGLTETASVSRTAQASAPTIGAREQASLAAELKRQLKPHWRPPSGADIEKLRVTVVASLAQDGSIVGEPRVIGPTGVTPSNRAQAELFVERAVTAVKRGAPYNFPKPLYAAWKTIRPQLYEGL